MARKTNNKNGTTGGSTGSAAAKRSGSRKTGNRSSSSGRKKSASSAGRASSSSRKTGTTSAKKRASAASSRKNAALEKARQEKMLREREIRMDLALLVLLFLTVFVFMSLLGFGKGVGKALADLLFGFFGFSAWLYPAWLFLYGVLLITRKGGRQRLPRMLSLLLLLVVVQTAAHLKLHVTNEISLETPFDASETFRLCAKIQGGGGVIGGWIARILYRIFGLVVSGILLAALAVAGIIQVFRFSPAGFLRRRRRAREAASDFHERRGFYRQQRLEELDREEEEALDRQAERILRREDELERRAQAGRERETARRARRRSAGSGMDLEEIRVLDPGRRTRTRSRRPETETSGNRINPAAAPARRDVHEITVLTTETKDPLTIPAVDRRGTGSSSPGTVPVRPVRARGDSPEPDGTRFERSSTSSAPRAASLPPETNRPKDPGTETTYMDAGGGAASGTTSAAGSGSGFGMTAAAGTGS
ncbi:MAG: DNA translocase FtsK 4TM domain-containing protein, partial [Eubacteriales bacterium]|nr:DNA translocase FtsK 4TM domain-containing protein [Eubacteriales bacterium]